MSTSFEAFPPPPGVIYPTTTTTTTTDNTDGEQGSSEHSSSGSFGMVFVVLAIILVVSSIACVLGRFCSKKSSQPKPHKQKHNHGYNNHHNDHKNKHNTHDHKNKHNNHHHKHGGPPPRPKDRDLEFGYRSREGDIMLGFDQKVKIPSSKVANYNNNGDFRGDNSFGSGRGGMVQHGGGNYVHGMHNFKGDHPSFGSGRVIDHGGNFNMPRNNYP